MRIAFFLNTPAQVHLYKHAISELKNGPNEIFVLARDYGDTISLLDELGIEHHTYLDVPKSKSGKLASFPSSVVNAFSFLKYKNPDLVVDAGVYGAITSRLLGCRCLVFSDSEPTPIQFLVLKFFADTILTPDSFSRNLGKKQLRIDSYKELAYLHPSRFAPDPTIHSLLGVERNEPYAVVRFNGFDAVHDFRAKGFSLDDKRSLIEELSKHCRVFVSSESTLPADLQKLALVTPRNRIHDVLYYAKLLVTDTQTMATEGAVLGIPTIRFNSFVGENDMGNFVELEKKYSLVINCSNPRDAVQHAVRFAANADMKKNWTAKRDLMLKDKVDLTAFLVRFIGAYPDSVSELNV